MKRSTKTVSIVLIFFLIITIVIVGRIMIGNHFKKKFSKIPPPGIIVTEVIEKELKGYQAINHLLNVFVKATINNQKNNTTAFDTLALACIPKSFIHKNEDLYTQLLDVCCFVASLTDGKALEWYKKMS